MRYDLCTLAASLQRLVTAIMAAAVVAATPHPTSAQSLASIARPAAPGQTSAESFIREYVAAVRKGDWGALGRYYHPEALAEFRAASKLLLESNDPKARDARVALSGSDSGASLREMSDDVFFTTFSSRVFSVMPKDLLDMLFKPMGEVIGAVPDGADVAHVVYRTRMPVLGKLINTTDVLTAKRTATGWGVLLNREFSLFLIGMTSELQ